MRFSLATALVLPAVLTGCPALLSDWTVSENSAGDASLDSGSSSSGSGGSGNSTSGSVGLVGSGGSSSSGGLSGSTGGTTSSGGSSSAGSGGMLSDGSSSSGGWSGSDGGIVDACALVTHDNGMGQTWEDCVPLETYNEEQAMKACAASGATRCLKMTNFGCGTTAAVMGQDDTQNYIATWGYAGYGYGYVDSDAIAGCSASCPCAAEGTWN